MWDVVWTKRIGNPGSAHEMGYWRNPQNTSKMLSRCSHKLHLQAERGHPPAQHWVQGLSFEPSGKCRGFIDEWSFQRGSSHLQLTDDSAPMRWLVHVGSNSIRTRIDAHSKLWTRIGTMPDWHKLVGKDVHLYMVGAVDLKKGHCSVHYQQACPRLMTGNARPPASYLQHFLRLFQSDQNISELMYTDVRFIHLHTT
jgi:hypothetical protein